MTPAGNSQNSTTPVTDVPLLIRAFGLPDGTAGGAAAIRNPPNSNSLNPNSISNRHKTSSSPSAASRQRAANSKILIDTGAIRDPAKPRRINKDSVSNRSKTRPSRLESPVPNRRALLSGLPSKLQYRTSNLQFLIGSPVIRIPPKPFAFSAESVSNRHKVRLRGRRRLHPGRICGTATLANAALQPQGRRELPFAASFCYSRTGPEDE
jgi:hypothetical protein